MLKASLTFLSNTGAIRPSVTLAGAKFAERQARSTNENDEEKKYTKRTNKINEIYYHPYTGEEISISEEDVKQNVHSSLSNQQKDERFLEALVDAVAEEILIEKEIAEMTASEQEKIFTSPLSRENNLLDCLCCRFMIPPRAPAELERIRRRQILQQKMR